MSENAFTEDYDYASNDSYLESGWEEPCVTHQNLSVVVVLAPYVHSLICALGLVGNALVIVTFACYKRRRSMTDVYLLNVAAADLLFALTLPLVVYSQLWAWPLGAAGCKLLRGSYSVNLYAGMLLLACVSVDRYVAVVQARRSFRLRSPAKGWLVCGGVWACALLLSVPTFYFYTWYQPSHASPVFLLKPEGAAPSLHVCEFRFNDPKMAVAMKVAVPSMQLAAGFFLPLGVMVGCYTSVIATLMKAQNFQRHKAVRVVLLVVAVFVVSNLPYNVTLLYDTTGLFREQSCGETDARQTALTLTETLAYLHCCLNPLLYAFVGVKFRAHFRRMCWDLCRLLCCRCETDEWRRGSGARRGSSRATSEVFVSSARRSVDSSGDASSFTM